MVTAPHHAPEETTGLALRVREATAERHKRAENRAFISQLMGGELTIDHYAEYLAQYARVYKALESRPVAAGDPGILTDRRLDRAEAIACDLVALGAVSWEERYEILEPTQAYVDRLCEVHGDVPRYLAHHYTRYLGDLSGGQAIGALVGRHYGATQDQLAFYRFEHIESPVVYKRAYRAGLDALNFTPAQEQAFLDEACLAFDLNAGVFDALSQVAPRAIAA